MGLGILLYFRWFSRFDAHGVEIILNHILRHDGVGAGEVGVEDCGLCGDCGGEVVAFWVYVGVGGEEERVGVGGEEERVGVGGEEERVGGIDGLGEGGLAKVGKSKGGLWRRDWEWGMEWRVASRVEFGSTAFVGVSQRGDRVRFWLW